MLMVSFTYVLQYVVFCFRFVLEVSECLYTCFKLVWCVALDRYWLLCLGVAAFGKHLRVWHRAHFEPLNDGEFIGHLVFISL